MHFVSVRSWVRSPQGASSLVADDAGAPSRTMSMWDTTVLFRVRFFHTARLACFLMPRFGFLPSPCASDDAYATPTVLALRCLPLRRSEWLCSAGPIFLLCASRMLIDVRALRRMKILAVGLRSRNVFCGSKFFPTRRREYVL